MNNRADNSILSFSEKKNYINNIKLRKFFFFFLRIQDRRNLNNFLVVISIVQPQILMTDKFRKKIKIHKKGKGIFTDRFYQQQQRWRGSCVCEGVLKEAASNNTRTHSEKKGLVREKERLPVTPERSVCFFFFFLLLC